MPTASLPAFFMIKHYLLILLLLIVIGLFTHYPSFNLSVYGDAWQGILNCIGPHHTGLIEYPFTGNLPGVLTYLTPYGPTNCFIALQYMFFGLNYQWYYVLLFVLKILIAFSTFLFVESILLKRQKLIPMLSAVLFLVGFPGIENTDWILWSSVYFSTALFVLSLLFKHKYLIHKQGKYLILSSLLTFGALISTPTRLSALVLIVPMIDMLILFSKVYKFKYSQLIISDVILIISTYLFWLVGLFGAPGKVFSYGTLSPWTFIDFVSTKPLQALNSLFNFIDVIVIPNEVEYLGRHLLIGTLFFLFFTITTILFLKNKTSDLLWSMISQITFLIFLLSVWAFNPVGPNNRYLLLPFVSFCFVMASIVKYFSSSRLYKVLVVFATVILIFLHWSAVTKYYNYLLASGRDSNFINKFESLVFTEIKLPVSSKKFIYINVGDPILHAVSFGLQTKIVVLSRNWNGNMTPPVYSQKDELFEALKKEASHYSPLSTLIDQIFAYEWKDQKFISITADIRKEAAAYLNSL